jgi:hypothetical protein
LAVVVVDEEFRHPRLAVLYDALDPDRCDLEAYVDLVIQVGADRVLDVGCGTEIGRPPSSSPVRFFCVAGRREGGVQDERPWQRLADSAAGTGGRWRPLQLGGGSGG